MTEYFQGKIFAPSLGKLFANSSYRRDKKTPIAAPAAGEGIQPASAPEKKSDDERGKVDLTLGK